jgi:small subunit ribosomal protein S18e
MTVRRVRLTRLPPPPPAEVMYALTAIPGVGRRISNLLCKKAEINMAKRAGEVTADEIERVVAILQNPRQFKIPEWMLNRRRDRVDGKSSHLVSGGIATKLREDIEALKKVGRSRRLVFGIPSVLPTPPCASFSPSCTGARAPRSAPLLGH